MARLRPGLPAEGRQQAIGPLSGDDLLHELRPSAARYRPRSAISASVMIVAGLELTRTTRDALFAQRAAGLRAGIVELGGLPDDDRAGADDHHFFDGSRHDWELVAPS